jgi:hypothetical protein
MALPVNFCVLFPEASARKLRLLVFATYLMRANNPLMNQVRPAVRQDNGNDARQLQAGRIDRN